jgi:hypothetical protein
MISRKIEEWNRQDAKVAERKKRLRENSEQNFKGFFPLCVLLAIFASWRFPSPHFFLGLTTPESMMSQSRITFDD